MTTPFGLTRDINGYNGFGLEFTDQAYYVTLDDNTNTTLTVPESSAIGRSSAGSVNKFIAVFSYTPGSSIWVSKNSAASAPSGPSFVATSGELNPTARMVNAGDSLNFFTTQTGNNVSVLFFAVPGG